MYGLSETVLGITLVHLFAALVTGLAFADLVL